MICERQHAIQRVICLNRVGHGMVSEVLMSISCRYVFGRKKKTIKKVINKTGQSLLECTHFSLFDNKNRAERQKKKYEKGNLRK